MPAREVITRRNLPHWYMPGAVHFITYRLADTIPAHVVAELRAARGAKRQGELPVGVSTAEHRRLLHKQFFADYDRYLDNLKSRDWLARPEIAAMIRGNLYHHDGGKYHLLAYCIMPNHVHVLLQPIEMTAPCASETPEPNSAEEWLSDEIADQRSPLSSIMHSLKSYTANKANLLLQRAGRFWQSESYDHWVRDTDELCRIAEYISGNPVKAGLVSRPEDWFFASVHDRMLKDGVVCPLLKNPV